MLGLLAIGAPTACGADSGELTGSGGRGGPTGTGGAAIGTGGSVGSGGQTGNPDAMPGAMEPVHGLTISGVSIYQAAKVLLTKMGQPVTTLDTPLVTNRPALVRVSVTPQAGWTPRPVVARLTFGEAGAAPKDVMATISAASTDRMLESTLNFQLAATDLTASVEWKVALFEAPGGTGPGATTGTAIPADGTMVKLTSVSSGPALKIVFVPVRNNNLLPDTSPTQLKYLTDAMFSMYPVAKVEAEVHEPVDFPTTVSPLGQGWDQALNQVCIQRQMDDPARNVFYHGLITPTASYLNYCAQGVCVEGIAMVAGNPLQDLARCSISIGYTNQGAGTFLHEMAHSMGRLHAPCGSPARPDPTFPYANGGIGVWGYDMVRQRLVDPARTTDFLAYCPPAWISDYTFANLLPWIKSVNALEPSMARFTPAPWRVATVTHDGSIAWGQVVNMNEVAGGTPHTVSVRDMNGRVTKVSGLLFPHSSTGGGMLLLPASVPARVRGVRFGTVNAFRSVQFD